MMICFQDRRVSFNEKKEPLSAHLLNMRGSQWRGLRAKLTPTFTSGKIKMMFSLMVECVEELKDFLTEPATRSEVVEVKEIMAKFTTDVIGNCAFGIKCNSLKNPDSEFRTMGRKVVEPSLSNVLRRMLALVVPIFGIRVLPWEVTEFFISAVKKTIENREKQNIIRNDFMQLLLELKNKGKVKDEDENSNDVANEFIRKAPLPSNGKYKLENIGMYIYEINKITF